MCPRSTTPCAKTTLHSSRRQQRPQNNRALIRPQQCCAFLRRLQAASLRSDTTIALSLFRKRRGNGLGPVGKMVQGFGVRGIEVQRRDRNGAREDRGVVRVWLDVPLDALFEQPEIAATARIFAFAQLVARDFLGLPRELYTTVPRFRHVHVEQHLVRQALLENHFRGGPRYTRGIFKFRIFSFRAQRDRHRWNVVQRAFPRRPHGPRVVHVFTEVRAVVDSGNQQVRLFRQKLVQRHDHAIRGGAVNGPLALRNAVAHDGLPERQRLRRAALLAARGNNAQCYNIRKLLRERPQPFRLISIVVCQKYMSHMSLEHFVAQNAWVTLSAGSHLSYQG